MSLIKCPECSKMISDKSSQCVHCGYPIAEDIELKEKLYKITIIDIDGVKQNGYRRQLVSDVLKDRYNISDKDNTLENELKQLPKTVLVGIPESLLDVVSYDLESIWCTIKVEEYSGEKNTTDFGKVIERVKKLRTPLRCPRCSSDQITTGSRGYSLLWGFLGSNKTVNRCGKCGYTWKP